MFKYRPNNALLKVKVVFWDESFHLPVSKKTGRNTIKEFLYWDNATFEHAKGSEWLFIYPKKRFTRVLTDEESIDKANAEYKDLAISLMRTFATSFPQVKLDEFNAIFKIKEFEIKDSTLKLPKDLRFNDTVVKKVYDSGVEFKKDPVFVKNFFKNRALENQLPSILDIMKQEIEQDQIVRQNLETHIATLKELKNGVIELKDAVKELKLGFEPKKQISVFARIKNFFRGKS